MDFYRDQDIIGWRMAEKLDGVFARLGKSLFTRDWTVLQAPDSLTAGCPGGPGEICHPQGLERVQGCRTWGKEDPRWEGCIFTPHMLIPSVPVTSIPAAEAFYRSVVARGGEGIVFTSSTGEMLKLKPSRDAEAEVIGYTDGTGRNPGIGSLVVLWDDLTFNLSVGLSNRHRLNPAPIGSFVTFSYQGFTSNGLPRSARFMRQRIAV